MILCLGSWDRPGGLNTMFQFYFHRLNLDVPHFWILLGKTNPPPALRALSNVFTFTLKEDWSIVEDHKRCEPSVKSAIENLACSQGAKLLFLPLEYHFFSYVRDLALPTFYISHLLNRPLILSTSSQWYADWPEVKGALHADRLRSCVEAEAIANSDYLICNSPSALDDLQKHYKLKTRARALGAWAQDPLDVTVPSDSFVCRLTPFGAFFFTNFSCVFILLCYTINTVM